MDKLSLEDARQMVKDGDIDLGHHRAEYKQHTGEDCKLSDDQMLEVIRIQEDDMESEEWTNLFISASVPLLQD